MNSIDSTHLIIDAEGIFPIKGIQIYIGEEPFLIIKDSRKKINNFFKVIYHGEILKEFLDEKRIVYDTNKFGFLEKEYPKSKGSNNLYEVVGMFCGEPFQGSVIEIDKNSASSDYKIGFNEKHLREMKERQFIERGFVNLF